MKEIRSLFLMLFRRPSRSIGTKLFLIFFCFLGASVAALGLLSSSIAREAIVSQMKKSSEETIALAGEKLDMKQQFYVDLSNQLINNSSFTENLFQIMNDSLSAGELQRRSSEIRGLLDQLVLSDPNIRDITLFPLEDALQPISTEREAAQPSPDAQWMRQIRQAEGKPVWLGIEEKGIFGTSPKPLFAYGRLLGKQNIGSHDFVLLVQIEASVLQGIAGGIKLSEGAETAVVDHTGNRIVSNRSVLSPSPLVIPAGEKQASGYFTLNGEGEERIVVYRNSPVSGWAFVGIAPLDELTGAVHNIQSTTYWFIAGNVLLALIIGIWVVIMVGKPLSRMQTIMESAADGNLSGRLATRGRDEIGQLAQACNRMMEQIGRLVLETRNTVLEVAESSGSVANVAQQTADSSRDIYAAAGQIAEGAANLASSAEEGNENVDQMESRLTDMLELQGKMVSSAREVNDVCRTGGGTVSELQRMTADTEEHFRKVGHRVDGLQESARSIQDLLKMMTDMAKQTKILSLNASIEAVRSGAAGSSFKVIAEEIRRLSEQSDASIGHVGQLTEDIQREVSSTASAMSQALPFFQEMIKDVDAVHQLFSSIQKQMGRLIDESGNVTSSMDELDRTQARLSQSMAVVSAVSQESSVAAGQVESRCAAQLEVGEQLIKLSAKMKQVSGKLELHMSNFRI